jgi:hypothetical protein
MSKETGILKAVIAFLITYGVGVAVLIIVPGVVTVILLVAVSLLGWVIGMGRFPESAYFQPAATVIYLALLILIAWLESRTRFARKPLGCVYERFGLRPLWKHSARCPQETAEHGAGPENRD